MLRPHILVALLLTACAASKPPMGTPSELSISAAPLCQHRVPGDVCTQCNPALVPKFKAVNDWCPEHGVPESQCHACHPGLSFEPLPALPAQADIAKLTATGEDVGDLERHAVAGKVTVFDFYADWCAPCRTIDVHVHKLLQARSDIALRKLNVVDWESALARRHLQGVPNLPYVVVYGKDGKKVRAIAGVDLAALDRAIADGGAR